MKVGAHAALDMPTMGLPGSERRYIYKASEPTLKTEAILTRNTDIVGRALEGLLKLLQPSKFGLL